MASAALLTAWLGGLAFFLFWLVAAIGIFVEWWKMTGARVGWKFPGFLYAASALAAPVVLRMDASSDWRPCCGCSRWSGSAMSWPMSADG